MVKCSDGFSGTMVNRGTLNWSGSNTTYTVPAGYYSGGTLDSRPSYNSGVTAGKDQIASGGMTLLHRWNSNEQYSGNIERTTYVTTKYLGEVFIASTSLELAVGNKAFTKHSWTNASIVKVKLNNVAHDFGWNPTYISILADVPSGTVFTIQAFVGMGHGANRVYLYGG